MNARRRRDFLRPLVEWLEPRRPLACQVLFENGTLTILGDDSDNSIEVFASKQGILVTCDGVRSGPFTDVERVSVLGGAGRDGNKFDAAPALGAGAIKDTDGEGIPEIVDFFGGPGIDAFEVSASFAKRLTLDGGEDADNYVIQLGRLFGSVRVADDGSSGQDSLELLGTRFAEVIEIAGLRPAGGGDADLRIRVASEPTITMPDELLLVAMEDVTVATAGGADQIVMREVDGPLAHVDWTIDTGAGSDSVDARLATIPNVLHVLTGRGDDEVSLAFSDNPNIPPLPRDPNPPTPEIMVDVGAGVDSVMLDVFGSLLAPQGDTAPQITLTEVLASIHITGVGLLSLLTLFPLGALEMQQAIQDHRGGHATTVVDLLLDGADLELNVGTGKTQNAVLLGIHPQPASRIDLNVQTGGADDQIEIRSTSPAGPLDWTLDVLPGGGDDEVLVAFERGDPDQPIIVGSVWNADGPPAPPRSSGGELSLTAKGQTDEFFVDFDLVGTPGPDDLQLNVFSPADPRRIVADIDIATGRGDDTIDVNLESAAEVVEQKVQIDSGAGADGITVLLRRLANPHIPPDVETEELSDLDLRAGEGNDVVRVDYLPSRLILKERAQFAIDGGGGNDQVTAHLQIDASEAIQKVRIDGGDGRDRLSLDFRGAILDQSAVDVVMRGGAGNDQVRARFDLDSRSTGELSAQVFGDDGNDELGLAVLGADHLALLFALLDGGRGKDRCRTTANVTVLNCP